MYNLCFYLKNVYFHNKRVLLNIVLFKENSQIVVPCRTKPVFVLESTHPLLCSSDVVIPGAQ